MDAVIYCRISQDREGGGLGVERQEAECRQLAEAQGWNVTHVYVDNDVSAYTRKPRPQYVAMLKDLAAGGPDALVAWHTDRLYRSLTDLADLVEVCDEHKVEIRTVKAGTVDLSTPTGRLSATMFAGLARYEVERMAERVKAAKDQQAQAGKFRGGGRPFGYTPDGMELVPVEADALRDAAQHLLSGGSLMAVSRLWQETGIKSARGRDRMTVTSIRRLLVRARNAGMVEQQGKIIGPALWPAIFDMDTLHAVKAVLSDPTRRTATSYERAHQGAGIYKCGKCGAGMRVFKMNGKAGYSYRCEVRPHLSQNKEHLDEYIDALVVGRLEQEGLDVVKQDDGIDRAALQMDRDGFQARKDELAAMFATGDLDGSQLRRGSSDLQGRIDRIDARLAAARETTPAAGLIEGTGDMRERWETLSPDIRGKIINQLMAVTIMPVGSGAKPKGGGLIVDRVQIEWKV